MRDSTIRSLADLQQFDVNRRNEYEGIRQTLYDFATYAAAGQTNLQFFQIPKGQAGKTAEDTSMTSAGQLPQPQNFLVESVEVHFYPGVDPEIGVGYADDMNSALTSASSLDFFIGSKSYLVEGPLVRFPPKTKLATDGAGSTTFIHSAPVGRPYYLDPPVLLVPNQNFSVTLEWKAAVAISVDARIGVVLDGVLYRQSQ